MVWTGLATTATNDHYVFYYGRVKSLGVHLTPNFAILPPTPLPRSGAFGESLAAFKIWRVPPFRSPNQIPPPYPGLVRLISRLCCATSDLDFLVSFGAS